MPWKELDHPADVRLEISAETLEGLFQECADAFYSVSIPMRTTEKSSHGGFPGVLTVQSTEDDLTGLFVAWMNELLFFLETENKVFLPVRVEADIQKGTLIAQGRWTPAGVRGGRVKAVTYGGLELDPGPPWRLRVILDV